MCTKRSVKTILLNKPNPTKMQTKFITLLCILLPLYGIAKENPKDTGTKQTSEVMAENTCILKVFTKHGSPANHIRVTTDVSGGIQCSGGRTFTTDRDGEVILRWVSSCYLRKIYVDGKSHIVDYKNGGTYYFKMN